MDVFRVQALSFPLSKSVSIDSQQIAPLECRPAYSVVAAAAWNDIVSANLEALGKVGNVWS